MPMQMKILSVAIKYELHNVVFLLNKNYLKAILSCNLFLVKGP